MIINKNDLVEVSFSRNSDDSFTLQIRNDGSIVEFSFNTDFAALFMTGKTLYAECNREIIKGVNYDVKK